MEQAGASSGALAICWRMKSVSLLKAAESLAPPSDQILTWSSHLSASQRTLSLQAFKAAKSSWEALALAKRLAYGMDLFGMSAGRLQAGKG
jgi:late competence protein required for DNA uptake (superfamily II DNA/RNA helicase)